MSSPPDPSVLATRSHRMQKRTFASKRPMHEHAVAGPPPSLRNPGLLLNGGDAGRS
jgi:hypothetical protein